MKKKILIIAAIAILISETLMLITISQDAKHNISDSNKNPLSNVSSDYKYKSKIDITEETRELKKINTIRVAENSKDNIVKYDTYNNNVTDNYMVDKKQTNEMDFICDSNASERTIDNSVVNPPPQENIDHNTKRNTHGEFPKSCRCDDAEWVTIKNATCQSVGNKELVCNECGNVIRRETIPQTDHVWEWIETVKETPVSKGYREKMCTICGQKKRIITTVTLVENELWIDSAGIDVVCTVGSLTQDNVDDNSVVLSYDKTPCTIIAGHNYYAFQTLHYTTVDSFIYIKRNGELQTYKVYVSEPAFPSNDSMTMTGAYTGTDFYDCISDDILRLYTCYFYNFQNNRWMVLARRV